MKLADKIIKLRKQLGWSQEELAEKMSVSRQSVSKWESATSIPDMNKIIKLSEIFSVSTDFLLKDEIENVQVLGEDVEEGVLKVSLETVTEYLQSKKKVSKMVSNATLLFIFSVLPLFLLLGLSYGENRIITENVATGVGMTCLLIMVAMGVVLAISSGSYKKHFEIFEENEFELEYGVKGVVKDMAEEFKSVYTRRLSISVTMFIVSSVPLILSAIYNAPDWVIMFMLSLLIVIVGFGVYLLVPYASKNSSLNCILGIGEFSPKGRIETKRAEKLASFYWPLVTAIYLGWSFITMDWGITWIVWPVAGVGFAAVVGFAALIKSKEE